MKIFKEIFMKNNLTCNMVPVLNNRQESIDFLLECVNW